MDTINDAVRRFANTIYDRALRLQLPSRIYDIYPRLGVVEPFEIEAEQPATVNRQRDAQLKGRDRRSPLATEAEGPLIGI